MGDVLCWQIETGPRQILYNYFKYLLVPADGEMQPLGECVGTTDLPESNRSGYRSQKISGGFGLGIGFPIHT